MITKFSVSFELAKFYISFTAERITEVAENLDYSARILKDRIL